MNSQLRQTIIALLDDEDGLNAVGYTQLKQLATNVAPGENDDIFNAVTSTSGRYYLHEDHEFTAEPDKADPTVSTTGHVFCDCGGMPRCTKCGCDEEDAYVAGIGCIDENPEDIDTES
jgi:hypothetical protein